MQQLFPDAYILTHSVPGKAANSKTEKKPPFDSRLYSVLISPFMEKFQSATTNEITEKVHSVHTFVKNEEKK